MRSSLPSRFAFGRGMLPSKPNSGRSSWLMSRAPRLLVRKIMLFSKFTSVLSPSRSVPLSRTPSSSRTSVGAAFSISSNSTIDRSHDSLAAALSFCCVSKGCVSRCPKYPGGAPNSFATSCSIWYSPQSTLSSFLGLPCSTSASASTVLVFPVPVGPSSRKTPAGRPSGVSRARYISTYGTIAAIAAGCPTSLRDKATRQVAR